MASKIPFILGLGAGYVLGTRAGRAQYERIKATAADAVKERLFGGSQRRSAGASGTGPAEPVSPVAVDDAEVRPA